MIGVLTHHWAIENKLDAATRLLQGNGEAQSKAPGFGSRQTLYSLSDPSKITTLLPGIATKSTMPGAPARNERSPWPAPALCGLRPRNRSASK